MRTITDIKYKTVAGRTEFTEQEYIDIQRRFPQVEIDHARALSTRLETERIARIRLDAENERARLTAEKNTITAERADITEELRILNLPQPLINPHELHILVRDRTRRGTAIDSRITAINARLTEITAILR